MGLLRDVNRSKGSLILGSNRRPKDLVGMRENITFETGVGDGEVTGIGGVR